MPLFDARPGGIDPCDAGVWRHGGRPRFSPLSFGESRLRRGGYPRCRHHRLLAARADPAAGRPAGAKLASSGRAARRSQLMNDLEAAFGAPVPGIQHDRARTRWPQSAAAEGAGRIGRTEHGTTEIRIMDTAGNLLKSASAARWSSAAPTSSRATGTIRGERDVVHERMVRTGDKASRPGWVPLTRRSLKELINRGGEKVSPREVDEVLLTHPAVAEAVCFGVPHATWGEEVEAAVVLREPLTQAELLAFCKERLADFKRPKQIHITDAIPRTATGKIQRRVVAAAYTKAAS